MTLSAASEMFALGSAVPFLMALTSPEKAKDFLASYYKGYANFSVLEIQIQLTLFFCLFVITSAVARIGLLYASSKFCYAIGIDLSYKIYKTALYQPYITHINGNSSELISTILGKSGVIVDILNSMINIFISILILLSVVLVLIIFQPIITLIVFIFLGGIYFAIAKFTKEILSANSLLITNNLNNIVKILQEGFGGIRDILLGESQKYFSDIYRQSDKKMREAQCNNVFISASPRFIIEALGMIAIAVLGFYLVQGDINAIPILAMLALAAQRVMPILQQFYSARAHINGNQAALFDAINFLNKPISNEWVDVSREAINFENKISFRNVYFKYPGMDKWIFEDVSFHINKGDIVGIVGKTGNGKSTLIDILIGLLDPVYGSIEVDGVVISEKNKVAWRKNIALVPQNIYIADISIRENIAFGVQQEFINDKKVIDAAVTAQLSEVIDGRELGYDSSPGERGYKLSGGQRQRLGIARGVYKDAAILILDEATSALDSDTEDKILNKINEISLTKTVLIISHKISTLRNCNKVLEIVDNNIFLNEMPK